MSEAGDGPDGEPSEYSNHRDQILTCSPSPDRINELQEGLLQAYKRVVRYLEVPVITFGDLNAEELAEAFVRYPIIVKPTLSCVNVAGRAIKRDLGIDLNTYAKKITTRNAQLLAGYIKPLLPPEIAVPALLELDRYAWTDKAMRLTKGRWEKEVTKAIKKASRREFKKRNFVCEGETFELDSAYPSAGNAIEVGVDVKRIESPRDIHKRADEIINKAAKFKRAHPKGRFFAVVYYPFPDQHLNLQSRLKDPRIDNLFFAGASLSSIERAADMLVGALGFSTISGVPCDSDSELDD